MPELFQAQSSTAKNRHIYTVSEITQDIKLILENTFAEVWVEGEVSGVRRIPSGTLFFTLKDNTSILKCVMFAYSAKTVKFQLKDGLKAICVGRIGVYEKEGQYQLYTDRIEPKGIGSLQLALEQLKEKLEKEGLFSSDHKRPMPYLPSRIGLVTSLSGAAIRDMLKVLDRRFSDVHVIVSPAQVQGEEAKGEISQAIKDLNSFNERLPYAERIEVIIVGRGGGSIEDLWAFNEEIVARAIYNSKIPVISAVGHERDWTIADLVADLRAPTPSVAAELVIPKKEDLRANVNDLSEDLKRSFLDIVSGKWETTVDFMHRLTLGRETILKLSASKFESTHKKLLSLNPLALIQEHKAEIIGLVRQIQVYLTHFLKLRQAQFSKAVEKLQSLSPLSILGRGYSITFKMPENIIIKDAKFVKTGDIIKTKLNKGEIFGQVIEIK